MAGTGPRSLDRAPEPVHVLISHQRTVLAQPGIVIHRTREIGPRVQWNRSPPRVRLEEAALDLAAQAKNEFDAVSVLAGVVSSRQSTAERLAGALELRKRIARRCFLAGVLTDVAQGTCSVLEHGYLNRVERPHGLPVGLRQAIDLSRGTLYRDVLYEQVGQIVELDGRLFHSGPRQRDADLDRDLDAAVDGLTGVRLGWGQVFDRACETAAQIALILRARGWTGRSHLCPSCSVPRDVRLGHGA